MAFAPSPFGPIPQFTDDNGELLVGGLLFTYAAGTTTKINTYVDENSGTPNANPIVLNARGECDLWFTEGTAYKLVLAPANDTDPPTSPFWTVDNLTAVTPNVFVGDSGSGGQQGQVPAPPAGSAAKKEYLGAGGSFVGLEVVPPTSNIPVDQAGYLGAPNNAQGANYAFQLSDLGGCVTNGAVGAVTYTIPSDATAGWPTGAVVSMILINNPQGSGIITVAPAAGVTLLSAPSFSSSGSRAIATNGLAQLFRTGANSWVLSGAGVS